MNYLVIVATFVAVFLGAQADANATERLFCFNVRMSTTDSGVGEDRLNTSLSEQYGAYVRARVRRNGVTVASGYADAFGCMKVNTPNGGTYNITMYGEARPRRAGSMTQYNNLRVLRSNGLVPAWNWTVTGSPTWRTLSTSRTRRSNLLGIGILALQRYGIDRSGQLIQLKDAQCTDSAENTSCYIVGDSTIYLNNEHASRKFVIAHEIGHAVSRLQTGSPGYNGYSYYSSFGDIESSGRAMGSKCQWTAGSHHLHSVEYSATAFEEGWAQFYATIVFNYQSQTNAYMHYYKGNQLYCENDSCALMSSPQQVNMEGASIGGANAFLRNECNCNNDSVLSSCNGNHSVKNGLGVELDWARAFWDHMTNSGAKPSWKQMLAQLGGARLGMYRTDAWDDWMASLELRDNAWGTNFASRFESIGDFNGVNF